MSSEDFEVFKQLRKERQAKHHARLIESRENPPDLEWKECSPYHYQRDVLGSLFDWWPSAAKFRFRGRTFRGTRKDVENFIRNREAEAKRLTSKDLPDAGF